MTETTESSTGNNNNALREKLSTKVVDLRTKLECSQAALADAIGASRSYVNRIESQTIGLDLGRAEGVVRKAYEQFGLPYEAGESAPAATSPAPAQVDREVLTRSTRAEVARRVTEFQREFDLSTTDLATLFGISAAHVYVLKAGREGSGLAMRKKAIQIIERETKKRRAQSAPAVVAAPSRVRAAPAADKTDYAAIALVAGDKEMIANISFDCATRHRFQRLPNGNILIIKD